MRLSSQLVGDELEPGVDDSLASVPTVRGETGACGQMCLSKVMVTWFGDGVDDVVERKPCRVVKVCNAQRHDSISSEVAGERLFLLERRSKGTYPAGALVRVCANPRVDAGVPSHGYKRYRRLRFGVPDRKPVPHWGHGPI